MFPVPRPVRGPLQDAIINNLKHQFETSHQEQGT